MIVCFRKGNCTRSTLQRKPCKNHGVVFNWKDETPQKFVNYYSEGITEYIPGEFNKCELPFILILLEQIELNVITAIIVDATSIPNRGKYGPGGYYLRKPWTDDLYYRRSKDFFFRQ